MDTIKLNLLNIKCEGCVNTIKTAMEKHINITKVEVSKETGNLTIVGENVDHSGIVAELTALGYPESKKGFFSKLFS